MIDKDYLEYKLSMGQWTAAEKLNFEYLSTIVELLAQIVKNLPQDDLKFKSPLLTSGSKGGMSRSIVAEGGSRLSP